MDWQLLHGDALDELRELPEASVDAVVTDPPYGLGFMGKAWDREVCNKWPVEALRVAKPGAHLLAFGGTRTYHRLACALEDAGWEIRDCLAWLYGSGFPKSHNLPGGLGTALKPAHEPIVLARKPLVGTVAANVEAHGTGALNVDACRVGVDGGTRAKPGSHRKKADGRLERWDEGYRGARNEIEEIQAGRWPPNVLLGHAACCGDACGHCCPVAELDAQSGEGISVVRESEDIDAAGATFSLGRSGVMRRGHTDSGTASRFFPRFRYEAKASSGERNAGLEGMALRHGSEVTGRKPGSAGAKHSARAGVTETPRENIHPTIKPIDLMRWLVRLVTPPGGLVLDPFAGSGTTLIAALREGRRCIGIEREAEYVEIARRRIEEDAPLFNRPLTGCPGPGSG